MKLNKTQILLLAAHWRKDIRTIKRWAKKDNPMLTHSDSITIINNNNPKINPQ